MKTTVKVTLANGRHWTTGINLSFADAVDYYLGKEWLEDERRSRCCKVENLETGEEVSK